jgi:hypothetical protein
MPIEEEPIIGAVYEDEEGRTFEVISFDEDEGTIEVQYEDETVNSLDLDGWYEMEITRISTPEDESDDEDEFEDDDDFEEDDDDLDEEDDDEDEEQ